jgi:uncharacterized protein
MLVRVSEIPDEGLAVEGVESFTQPFSDRSWRLEEVALVASRAGELVNVTGRLRARVPQTCARCLDTYQVEVSAPVDARFVPAPAGRSEEVELAADDLETDVYSNDTIDLGSLLETETTLGLPMKPLCHDTCRGLCPVCGANRNVTACSCPARAPDPRWAALQVLADRLPK